MGVDADSGLPWVAIAKNPDITLQEWTGKSVSSVVLKVPMKNDEKIAKLGQIAKLGGNLLLQFHQGENRFWKRKTSAGWGALDLLDCQGLSYVAERGEK
jgi:hypothetical protein